MDAPRAITLVSLFPNVTCRSVEFDAVFDLGVQGFASTLFQVRDEVDFAFSDELMPEYERLESPSYFELWFEGGRPLERSNSLPAASRGRSSSRAPY